MSWYKKFSIQSKNIERYSSFSKTEEILDTISKIRYADFNDLDNAIEFLTILSPIAGDSNHLKSLKSKATISLSPLPNPQTLKFWAKNHKDDIRRIINAIEEKTVCQYADKNLDQYELFVFDADKTIWDGTAAKDMEEPFVKVDENIIKDSNGNICKLRPSVKDLFMKLRAINKSIGILSHSHKDNTDHQDQPLLKLLDMFGLTDLIDEFIVLADDLPKSIFIPKDLNVIFIDDDIENLEDVIKHTDADVVQADDVIEKEAKREYIPAKERPKKPNDGREYELDHKKPKHKGGTDTKDNLQWVEKNKHKQKSSDEGSFEYGGKDRHKKLKNQGKDSYTNYQRDCGKKKVEKERKDMGEKAFSDLQRERAKKRWNKSSNRLQLLVKKASEIASGAIFERTRAVGQAFALKEDVAMQLIECDNLFKAFQTEEYIFSTKVIEKAVGDETDPIVQKKIAHEVSENVILPKILRILERFEENFPTDSCSQGNMIQEEFLA